MSENDEVVVLPADGFLDLGAVAVPLLEGLEISVNIDEKSMRGVGLRLTYGASIADVQIFARARNELMWPTTRDEMVLALSQQQVASQIVMGAFGSEVQCTMPTVNLDGNNMMQPVRFLGVDGDRWFMRIAISGAATVDPVDIEKMDALLSQLAVARGDQAMAPGEPLTFTFSN